MYSNKLYTVVGFIDSKSLEVLSASGISGEAKLGIPRGNTRAAIIIAALNSEKESNNVRSWPVLLVS
jgi:hypothetical protein